MLSSRCMNTLSIRFVVPFLLPPCICRCPPENTETSFLAVLQAIAPVSNPPPCGLTTGTHVR
eukprot:scaffold25978_cov122-Cylindrotheca_fusiformis.AAC.2